MARYKRSVNGLSTSVLLLIGLLTVLFLFLSGQSSSVKGTIKSLLTSSGYSDRVANWWVAISNLETGAWTSKLFKRYNNLFGMKQPLKRFSFSRGVSQDPPGYATFDTAADSVRDLIVYMEEFSYPKDLASVDDLVNFMQSKGYFEDPLYLSKVKSRL